MIVLSYGEYSSEKMIEDKERAERRHNILHEDFGERLSDSEYPDFNSLIAEQAWKRLVKQTGD
jgi:hypothetical protein